MLTVNGKVVGRTRRIVEFNQIGVVQSNANEAATGMKVTYHVLSNDDPTKLYKVTIMDPQNFYEKDEDVSIPVEVNAFSTRKGMTYELRALAPSNSKFNKDEDF